MNITTATLVALTPAQIAALPAHTVIVDTPVDLAAPALETVPVQAQDAPTEELLPVLTRSAWKTVRMTRSGKVRKAFVGMTREQAHEAGLTPGYRLPEGTMRAHLASLRDA